MDNRRHFIDRLIAYGRALQLRRTLLFGAGIAFTASDRMRAAGALPLQNASPGQWGNLR